MSQEFDCVAGNTFWSSDAEAGVYFAASWWSILTRWD
jgi:hypothetical protein